MDFFTMKFSSPKLEEEFHKSKGAAHTSQYVVLTLLLALHTLFVTALYHSSNVTAFVLSGILLTGSIISFKVVNMLVTHDLLYSAWTTSLSVLALAWRFTLLHEDRDTDEALRFAFLVIVCSVFSLNLRAYIIGPIQNFLFLFALCYLFTQGEASGAMMFKAIFQYVILTSLCSWRLRNHEIEMRRSFRMTKRLLSENVEIKIEMENIDWFTGGGNKLLGTGKSRMNSIAPGAQLNESHVLKATDIYVGKILGTGAFGSVNKGMWNNCEVAVKRMHGTVSKADITIFGHEAQTMMALRHPNIVSIFGFCPLPVMIVMEYMSKGSLFNVLATTKLSFNVKLKILLHTAAGMGHLHGQKLPILHKDLKSLNVLATNNYNCKVCDFGLAGLMRAREPQKNVNDVVESEKAAVLGTVAWTAPELFEEGDFSRASDVYAFGVIMFEVFVQRAPFEGTLNHAIPFMVSNGTRPYDNISMKKFKETSNGAGDELVALMKQCCRKDPEKRPSFQSITDILDSIGINKCGGEEWTSKISEKREAPNAALSEGTNSRFTINPDDLNLGPKLGAGNYGTVFEGIYQGTHVAAKEMIVERMTDEAKDEFYKECALMEMCRHPNIVLLMGYYETGATLMLVTELCEVGCLFSFYHSNSRLKSKKDHLKRVYDVSCDMAKGMMYLHQQDPPIIHRDLKSPNILIDGKWTAKIADFGMSRIQDQTQTMTKCGSPLWVAPEILRGERFGLPVDVFSFSIIVWEVLVWSEPYPNLGTKDVLKGVARTNLRNAVPAIAPPSLKKLIIKCWDDQPDKRPTFPQVLEELEKMKF